MKKTEKGVRELAARFGAQFEGVCGSGHYRVRLNGKLIIASSTPREPRFALNHLRQDLQRATVRGEMK